MALSPEKVNYYASALKASNYPENIQNPETAAGKKLAEIEEYLLGKTETVPVVSEYTWSYTRNLCKIFNPPTQWGAEDDHIFRLFLAPDVWIPSQGKGWFAGQGSGEFFSWINEYYHKNKEEKDALLTWLKDLFKRHKVSEEEILLFIAEKANYEFELYKITSKYIDSEKRYQSTFHGASFAGLYLLSFIPEKVQEISKSAIQGSRVEYIFELLARTDTTLLYQYGELFLDKYNNMAKNVWTLTQLNAVAYEEFILKIIPKSATPEIEERCWLHLSYAMPEKYSELLIKNSYTFFKNYGFRANYDDFAEKRLRFLLENDKENASDFLAKILSETYLTFQKGFGWVLTMIEEHFKAEGLPIIAQVFKNKDMLTADGSFYMVLLGILERYDCLSKYEKELWAVTKHKSKFVRELLASTLAKLGDAAIVNAQELLQAKSADARQTGALILAKIKTTVSEQILIEALNTEKNDDTRDVMVEALGEKFYQKLSEKQIAEFVEAAQTRGKLEANLISWLDLSKLPSIFYHNTLGLEAEKLTRFLLYRLSRAKEIRSEIEARLILPLINKANSADFAKQLFKQFVENGSDAKQKYCLTIAGFLGDDSLVDAIRPQITKWVDGNRGKMAEYGVVAIALVGSNKALRAVEFFSRKYKNKYPNIGYSALKALEVAAEELGMDMNELADSIIPDFGFENMYKNFQVGNEEYRAFINKDFKMAFLNEDGKIMKSAPKTTPKELLNEFKEIGKEVKDVVRSQSSRMELYLVIQRRWEKEKWMEFFLANPIMFVYATHIVWGIFDKNGTLQQTFYCTEDTTLLNLEDEEIELPENAQIGMVHPLSISEEEKNAWIDKFYNLGIEPIFKQMQRPVVRLEENDKNKNAVEEFDGKKGEPVAVKGLFRRFGWVAWGVEDHGDISSFAKTFDAFGIRAIINTGGGLYLGYDGGDWKAEFGTLAFDNVGKKQIIQDIALIQVPEIVYSEVMGELRQIVPTEEENKN